MKSEHIPSTAPQSLCRRHLCLSFLAWTLLVSVLLLDDVRKNHRLLVDNSLAMARPAGVVMPLAQLERTAGRNEAQHAVAFLLIWAAGAGGIWFFFRRIGLAAGERHRAEEKIRKLSLAVEQCPACIVITDTAGTIEFVNPRFVQLTGYSYEEAIGLNPRVLKSDETPAEVYRDLWTTIAAGNTWRGEFLNRKKNGELYWELATISPIRGEDGAITHYMAIKEDITEQKSLKEQLLQAQKMETIGRLTSCIAHDFNNILAPIVCYSEMLRKELQADGQGLDKVDRLAECAQRATRLVQQLLGMSRKRIVVPENFDQNTVIRSFYDFLRTVVRENIDIRLQLSPEPCGIRADRHQLEQIVMNLVLNAQDAIDDQGVIVVGTSLVELDEVCAKADDGMVSGRYCLLSVSDTGRGMDGATRERVFEPFFTTKPPGKGTGLGLAAVYGLTLQYGGHIRVYSEPGQGSTFKIYFPAVSGPPGAVTPESLASYSPIVK